MNRLRHAAFRGFLLLYFVLLPLILAFAFGLFPPNPADASVSLEPAALESAALNIATAPPKADVFLDGERRGRTPLVIRGVTPGPHLLRIELDGHKGWEAMTSLEPSMAYRLPGLPLIPEREPRLTESIEGVKGLLVLEEAGDAAVTANDELRLILGKRPMIGEEVVRLTLPEGMDEAELVSLPASGHLALLTRDRALVIDGEGVNRALTGELSLGEFLLPETTVDLISASFEERRLTVLAEDAVLRLSPAGSERLLDLSEGIAAYGAVDSRFHLLTTKGRLYRELPMLSFAEGEQFPEGTGYQPLRGFRPSGPAIVGADGDGLTLREPDGRLRTLSPDGVTILGAPTGRKLVPELGGELLWNGGELFFERQGVGRRLLATFEEHISSCYTGASDRLVYVETEDALFALPRSQLTEDVARFEPAKVLAKSADGERLYPLSETRVLRHYEEIGRVDILNQEMPDNEFSI